MQRGFGLWPRLSFYFVLILLQPQGCWRIFLPAFFSPYPAGDSTTALPLVSWSFSTLWAPGSASLLRTWGQGHHRRGRLSPVFGREDRRWLVALKSSVCYKVDPGPGGGCSFFSSGWVAPAERGVLLPGHRPEQPQPYRVVLGLSAPFSSRCGRSEVKTRRRRSGVFRLWCLSV